MVVGPVQQKLPRLLAVIFEFHADVAGGMESGLLVRVKERRRKVEENAGRHAKGWAIAVWRPADVEVHRSLRFEKPAQVPVSSKRMCLVLSTE